MAEVYAAVDVETDGPVALKCIRHIDLDGQAEARLVREVRMAARFSIPAFAVSTAWITMANAARQSLHATTIL